MELQLQQIRETQKIAWNEFSPGWKKWDDLTMDFLKPSGDEMIRQLNLKDDDYVLDVAAGTGEPGLTIASKVKNGKVIITDLSEGMLNVARDKASSKEIKNVEMLVSDVCELPFANNTFDAISCRMGFMFFPDMILAAKELTRVLKPGGRIATSVWHKPEENFWATSIMGIIKNNLNLPSPPPDAPGIFRCAENGIIGELFMLAGLKNISEKEITGKMNCETVDVYWNMMTEIAAPIVAALSDANETIKAKIKGEVFQAFNEKYPDGNVLIDSNALVIYGEK